MISALGLSATLDNRSQWLKGDFNGTTADKPSNSNLTIGYVNGSTGDKLKGFWRFDNGFQDYSGNQLQFLGSQNILFSKGVFGTDSVKFEALNEPYIEYANDQSLNKKNFTTTAWVKTGANDNAMPILEKSVGDTEGFQFKIDNYYNSDKASLFLGSSSQNLQRFRTDESVPQGEWTHLAATYNGSNVSLYINGVEKTLVDAGQTAATYNTSNQDLLVGASSEGSGGNYFNGSLDEIKIISPSLNSTEVKREYLHRKPFEGRYISKKFSYDEPRKWENVKTSSNISSNDLSANLTFQVSDDGFTTIKDSQKEELQGGKELLNLDVQDASEARIIVEGSTDNVTKSWVVESVKAEYFRDFKLNSINFNSTDFIENKPVGVDVKVSNTEPDFGDVKVQFIAEKFTNDAGWVQIYAENKTFSSTGFDSTILKYGFKPDKGPHRVSAEIDPNNNFNETNESNNFRSENFDVPLYGIFYGNTQTTVRLSDFNDQTFYQYKDSDKQGTIYFVDSDASFSFSDLQPLGDYNALEEADKALNSTGFNDSIQQDWGESQSIRRTECFFISGSDLCNVPVSNSTENSFFDTGIVYDGGSSYSKQDPIVFVSDMVSSEQGAYGKYDYEAKIPSTLPETQGSSEKIDVYREIE